MVLAKPSVKPMRSRSETGNWQWATGNFVFRTFSNSLDQRNHASKLAIGNWQLAPHKFETFLILLVLKAIQTIYQCFEFGAVYLLVLIEVQGLSIVAKKSPERRRCVFTSTSRRYAREMVWDTPSAVTSSTKTTISHHEKAFDIRSVLPIASCLLQIRVFRNSNQRIHNRVLLPVANCLLNPIFPPNSIA